MKNLGPEELLHLGEALGLTYPKLKRMANIQDEMVAAWLNQEDSVLHKSGAPTWSRLADALEEIGQRGAAEDIRRNKFHTTVRIVTQKSPENGMSIKN